MKPLLGMVTFNRLDETRRTVEALARTWAFEEAKVVIWDNGSQDGTADYVGALALPNLTVVMYPENIGCPRALNEIMWSRREPGQDFIKIDNDMEPMMVGWVGKLAAFARDHPAVAMVGPYYQEVEDMPGRVGRRHENWLEVYPLMGHCVLHAGWFLDRTGYFDVLSPDHLYGFEDNLMSTRAVASGFRCAIHVDITIENIQRWNSMDFSARKGLAQVEERDAHIDRLRPAYNARQALISRLGSRYRVGADGQPRTWAGTLSSCRALWRSTDA